MTEISESCMEACFSTKPSLQCKCAEISMQREQGSMKWCCNLVPDWHQSAIPGRNELIRWMQSSEIHYQRGLATFLPSPVKGLHFLLLGACQFHTLIFISLCVYSIDSSFVVIMGVTHNNLKLWHSIFNWFNLNSII